MGLRVLISEAFELYRLEHIVYLNQSKRTEEMSLYAMNSFIKFAGDINISDLTFDIIRKWKENLQQTRQAGTVRQYVLKMRCVLKHLQISDYKVLNYEKVGLPKKVDHDVDFLTPEEIDQLLEAAFKPGAGYRVSNRYKNRAMVSLFYSSGIRVSEIVQLDRMSLRKDNTFTIRGKGDKSRLCFFDERTRIYIDEYLNLRKDKNPALFISEQTGNRMKTNMIQILIRNLGKRASLERPIYPHIFRHSFATNLLRNNTNLLYVSKFLGHSSVQTTEMYTHVVDEDLRAIYNAKHTT